MTTFRPALPAQPSIQDLGEPQAKRHFSLSPVGVPLGALAYLAVSALAFSVDWKVAIPFVVSMSIAGVVVANRAVCTGLAVYEEADAFQRILLENERGYASVESDWARVSRLARGAVKTRASSLLSRTRGAIRDRGASARRESDL